ncbi:MAG: response regulator [Polaromonas sp.]|nr:response regulator [Polaromonas sp.]
MKLNDLIEALAAEIERVQPELDHALAQLAVLDAEDPAFFETLEQYSGHAQRMGEAAEMVGFAGLNALCMHVVENTLLMATMTVDEREPMVNFLQAWPRLIVHYLRNLSEPSCTAALVGHLRQAPHPLDEEQALKIAHMLGAMNSQVNAIFADKESARPVLARRDDVALTMPADADQKLLEGFFSEAPEQVRYLIELARNLAAGQGDSSDLIAARRVVHTLKGSGAIIGLRGLTSLGHHLEDILDHFEHDSAHIAKPVADVLLDAAYCLEHMVSHVLGSDDYPQQAQAVLQRVLDMANRIDRGESVDEAVERVADTSAPAPGLMPQGAAPQAAPHAPTAALRVNVERVDELFRVASELSVSSAGMEARLKVVTEAAHTLLAQNLRVQKRLFELETLLDVRALPTLRGRSPDSQRDKSPGFDPLEMAQYSELHSATYALIEEAADARSIAARLEDEIAQTASTHGRQQRLSKDLQHLVIGMRMTEIGTLASRLQRNVRSTCQATGKQAELLIEGGETQMDSDVLSGLAEPLLHTLRNAVDHGLETPAERLAAGKPESGRIVLNFSRQGQQVVLRCHDDGRGLDYAAIRTRAIERGLITPEQTVSDEELARLILTSGFSTRQSVTELSGRGVGLDVVREWASVMNGSIKISSRPGLGCTIELRFAASLSTMHALIVEAAGERFALPSVQIVRAVPRGVGHFAHFGDKLVYRHADKDGEKAYPAIDLAQAVGMPRAEEKALADFDAVIVHIDDKLHALAVERLIDSRELLVKSPGRYARNLSGITGLSILGDGGIAVNLDLTNLLKAGTHHSGPRQTLQAAPLPTQHQSSVLIVDDALSVRASLQQMVQDAGYHAQTARDGIEAINVLKDFTPDLVLTDLEMPNLNGVELTRHIRGRADLKELPIIMITSRSQEKHRQMAEQAGVSAYFTKPYNDDELLQTMRASLAA